MKLRLEFIPLVLAATVGLAGCASMQVVEKNLEEDRLVPEAAVDTPDILAEYRHPLPPPRDGFAGLDIALERTNVLDRGGKLLVQVGISTAPPAPEPVTVHALVFAPADAGENERAHVERAIRAMREAARELPGAASMTIDAIEPMESLRLTEPSLLADGSGGNLKDFLTSFARLPFADGEHHVVLLVGSYKGAFDLSGLSERERQDVVDIGRIFAAKSVTLSVLSVGAKPDFAFLRKLAEASRGAFNVATDSLEYDAWIKEDLRLRSAKALSDVELVLQPRNGARLGRVLAPSDLSHSANDATYTLVSLKEGEQRVVLAEIEIPPKAGHVESEILDVHLKYRAPATGRYHNIQETARIQYVADPNLTLSQSNQAIRRSLLILKTQETLQSVARDVRSRRTYLAIAALTAQSRALKEAGGELHDRELLRDGAILAKYANRLYDFDGEWFKAVTIWRDLSWDTRRF